MTLLSAINELRMAWWCATTRGLSFEATEKFHCQGRGGGPAGGPHLNWDSELAGVRRKRFRQECRRIGIDPSVFCILLTLAKWGACFPKDVYRFSTARAAKQLGVSPADVRMKEAIRRCLQRGLIVRLNQEELLRNQIEANTSCTPLVQQCGGQGMLELTEAGVSMLLDIGPRVLGDGWLNGWIAEREVFRREHRYAPDTVDVDSVYREYDAVNRESSGHSQERATIGSVQEIGPWCVYWWERFPKGYRVEVDVWND